MGRVSRTYVRGHRPPFIVFLVSVNVGVVCAGWVRMYVCVFSGAAWTLLGTDLVVESMVLESIALGIILESMVPCKGTDTALCQLCLLKELASLGLYYLKRLRT